MSLKISSGPLFVRIGGRYVQTEHTVEEFDQLRAELQRLQSSPAPVAGMVPDIADEDYESVAVLMYDHALGSHDDGNEEFRRIVAATWQCCQAYAVDSARAASRLPAIKPGEVVVAIPDPTGIVVDLPERYRERGIELVRNAIQWAREHARIVPRARPTTTEKETP